MHKKQVMTLALVIGGLYLLSRAQGTGAGLLPAGAMNPQGFPGAGGGPYGGLLPAGAMNPNGFSPAALIRNFLPGNAGSPTYGSPTTGTAGTYAGSPFQIG